MKSKCACQGVWYDEAILNDTRSQDGELPMQLMQLFNLTLNPNDLSLHALHGRSIRKAWTHMTMTQVERCYCPRYWKVESPIASNSKHIDNIHTSFVQDKRGLVGERRNWIDRAWKNTQIHAWPLARSMVTKTKQESFMVLGKGKAVLDR
jgi:hypothetical protein